MTKNTYPRLTRLGCPVEALAAAATCEHVGSNARPLSVGISEATNQISTKRTTKVDPNSEHVNPIFAAFRHLHIEVCA